MSTNVIKIQNHINEVLDLKEQFLSLSNRSIERFDKILDSAKYHQVRLDPLYRETESLQIQKRNIDAVYAKLNQIQSYRKTAHELESVIQQGPDQSLSPYLEAMNRIQTAYSFLMQQDMHDVEFTRLQGLYSLGTQNLYREFQCMLQMTFSPIRIEKLVGPEPVALLELSELETASETVLEQIRVLSSWMTNNNIPKLRSASDDRNCLSRYQEFRRELVRKSLIRLQELLRIQDSGDTSTIGRSKLQNQQSVATLRSRAKRPPGYVWDVNARRQINDNDTEELNSEHLAVCLGAFVKLIQNERRWLEHLGLTSTEQEMNIALDMILKVAANDIMNDGSSLCRLMQRAQSRAEYHMVLSLLLILKKLSQIGAELITSLKGLDHILFGFNSLVIKLLQQSSSVLENYAEFLRQLPEHSITTKVIVPPDGTVHELTTNVLMFLENLNEFVEIVALSLSAQESGPQNPNDATIFLCTNADRLSNKLAARVGAFYLSVLLALLTNLDRKSEAYSDDVIRLVFQLNNIHYILKAVQNTKIEDYILKHDQYSTSRVSTLLNERLDSYCHCLYRLLQLHSTNLSCFSSTLRRRASQFKAAVRAAVLTQNSTPRSSFPVTDPDIASLTSVDGETDQDLPKLNPKQCSALKSFWHDFNNGIVSLRRQHVDISIPDPALREALVRKLTAQLVPTYKSIYEQSKNVQFSKKRGKYMQYSVEQFESIVQQLFATRRG